MSEWFEDWGSNLLGFEDWGSNLLGFEDWGSNHNVYLIFMQTPCIENCHNSMIATRHFSFTLSFAKNERRKISAFDCC